MPPSKDVTPSGPWSQDVTPTACSLGTETFQTNCSEISSPESDTEESDSSSESGTDIPGGGGEDPSDDNDDDDESSEENDEELVRELNAEVEDFLAHLELEKGVSAVIIDFIVKKLHLFSTFGERINPRRNYFRDAMKSKELGSRARRLSMYRGKLGPPRGELRWIPGTVSPRPNMYYKSIKSHLEELLSVQDVANNVMGEMTGTFHPWYQNCDGFYHNYQSSERFKAISSHLGKPFVAIRVFGDAFGLHHLGAHRLDKNEVYAVYAQIASFPAHLCRRTTSWFTVSLSQDQEVEDVKQVWSVIVQDMEDLSENGIFVPLLGCTLDVVLVAYSGDLKDQNMVCSMAAPGGSNYPHTNALVTSIQRRQCQTFDDVNPLTQLRTRAGHENDIENFRANGNLTLSRGVSGRSVLDKIADFLHPGFLTVDVAHSYYLGTFRSDLSICLSVLNELRLLTEEEALGKLDNFKETLETPERSNFVTNLLADRKGFRINLKGSIGQMRLVAKYCTIIFIDICDVQDHEDQELVSQCWEIIRNLHQLFLNLESFAMSERQVEEFQTVLKCYITARIRLRDLVEARFTDERFDLLPKHIDLLFAASNIRNSGSLILSSTTIMESQHAIHKTVMTKNYNKSNPIKTLGRKCELQEKYTMQKILSAPDVLQRNWDLGKDPKVHSNDQRQAIKAAAGPVPVSRDAEVLGKTIKAGQIVDIFEDHTCSRTFSVKVLAFMSEGETDVKIFAEDIVEEYIPELDIYGIVHYSANVRILDLGALACPVGHTTFKSPFDQYTHIFTRAMIVPTV